MVEQYCVLCVLEGTVEASSEREGRRMVEDALLKVFDSEATKDSNPEMSPVKTCVGNEVVTLCGWNRPRAEERETDGSE